MRENRQTRLMLILNCEMTRHELFDEEEIEILEAHFQTDTIKNLGATDESEAYQIFMDTIEERIQNFNRHGSSWRFKRVLSLDLQLVDYIPLNGSSYIELPKQLKGKKAVINIKNEDQKCFMWCVLRHLHPDNHPERVSSLRQYENDLDFRDIEFPMKIKDISDFEKKNEGICVNVFGYEKREIYPIRFSKHENAIDLLYITNEEGHSHYCLIND